MGFISEESISFFSVCLHIYVQVYTYVYVVAKGHSSGATCLVL